VISWLLTPELQFAFRTFFFNFKSTLSMALLGNTPAGRLHELVNDYFF
jgi:hypothetical protein